MTKLKMRKRLTILVLAFMLTFTVGAAFAFAPGNLDIVATINLAGPDDAYVIWSQVRFYANPADVLAGEVTIVTAPTPVPAPAPGGGGGAASAGFGLVPAFAMGDVSQSASIINARGRTNQRIVWNLNFYDAANPGSLAITATALNQAAVDATIANATVTWEQADLSNPGQWITINETQAETIWGLTLALDDILFPFQGETLAPNTTRDLQAMITWDGSVHDDFTIPSNANPAVAPAVRITIDFVYAP
jgi:hypothetical protein